jgi:hypothetical protein
VRDSNPPRRIKSGSLGGYLRSMSPRYGAHVCSDGFRNARFATNFATNFVEVSGVVGSLNWSFRG